MTDPLSRRDWLRTMGVLGAGALAPRDALAATGSDAASHAAQGPAAAASSAPAPIEALTSTSGIYVPARGRGFMKFSFDFPEPSVVMDGRRFGFLVFTGENTYGLDGARMRVDDDGTRVRLVCDGFVWAGGQEKAPGTLTATFRRDGGAIEWTARAAMDRPIRAVTTIVRGVPRGPVSLGGGGFFDPRDDELLAGYPFGAGDLHGPGAAAGITTPLLMIQTPADVVFVSSRDDRVRPKRFYLAPGDAGYRVETVYEHDAWRDDPRVDVPAWRIGTAPTAEEAAARHLEHVERAFGLRPWDDRADVPAWMRGVALATTLHGMHETGFIFNDYARQLEILRWMATRIPGDRVLVFLPAWDGRYYWDYPTYRVSERMGGEAGFRRLVDEAHRLGFRLMPMYGTNAANRELPSWPALAPAVTRKIDGDVYNLNWVDWNNDRHQDGWLGYMNLGVDAWREHLASRIAAMIERYGVDAYFLDIVGGHVNSRNGDMHEGTRRLVLDLRARYPHVACVGEMPYDALHGFIPMFQVGLGRWQKYSRNFQHLSSPAPGRGSSGVHESGFGRFDEQTLGLYPGAIPTLQVVDDTFTQHRDTMAAIIEKAKQRAGIG